MFDQSEEEQESRIHNVNAERETRERERGEIGKSTRAETYIHRRNSVESPTADVLTADLPRTNYPCCPDATTYCRLFYCRFPRQCALSLPPESICRLPITTSRSAKRSFWVPTADVSITTMCISCGSSYCKEAASRLRTCITNTINILGTGCVAKRAVDRIAQSPSVARLFARHSRRLHQFPAIRSHASARQESGELSTIASHLSQSTLMHVHWSCGCLPSFAALCIPVCMSPQ